MFYQERLIMTSSMLSAAAISRCVCAYIDPGTGALIFQMIIAGLLGGLFAIKLFWSNIKNFVKKLFSPKQNPQKDEQE